MELVVQKYGGTSVGSIERILKIADKIIQTKKSVNRLVVVLSAMGKTTDSLLNMATEISQQPDKRELDILVSTGEQVSVALLAMALQAKGCEAVSLTGWQAGIITEPVHSDAKIVKINTKRIHQYLDTGKVVIVAGFQGVTESGEITTLGRGGSDTSAVALAASLKAEQCEIYTDVAGVFTADPRIVPAAKKISALSYQDMLELARLGASVLHPHCVETAQQYQVKLVVRSSFSDEEGTCVGTVNPDSIKSTCWGITHKRVVQQQELTKVSVVGIHTQTSPQLVRKILIQLKGNNIPIHWMEQRNQSISVAVPTINMKEAIQLLHKALGMDGAEDSYASFVSTFHG